MVEGGEYRCAVGASSRDLRTTATATVAGDDARVPLTAEATLGEWLADPRGAQALAAVFAAPAGEEVGPVDGFLADPTMMMFLSATPLGRLGAFPGSPLTTETVAKLIAGVND